MSVTFRIEEIVTGWVITCSCGDVRDELLYESYQGVTQALQENPAHLPCERCAWSGLGPRPHAVTLFDGAPEVNVSNENAHFLLEALSLLNLDEDAQGGALSGELFFGKVIEAKVLAPADTGAAPITTGSVVHCGRPAGYLQMRLEELASLATFAWDKGVDVIWG